MSYPTGLGTVRPLSPVIPSALIGILAVMQLLLGTSPAIVALCVAAVALPFLQLVLLGRDLYGVLNLVFNLKYIGFALVAKTLYGQTLDSHLYDPHAAFGLILLVMLSVTAMLIVARALDKDSSFFSFPMDLVSLRRLSVACICIGMLGNLGYAGSGANNTADAVEGGALIVLSSEFRQYYYFGLITESVYAILKSNGRSFITSRLLFLFIIELIISIAFNNRELVVSCVISVVVVGFLYDTIRIRHIVVGVAITYFFITVLTPITFYLRIYRSGSSFSEFAELAGSTLMKAATDPEYLKLITNTGANAFNQGDLPYDYYGLRSEALDRQSFISLLDAVYNGTRMRQPIGMAAVEQSLTRAAPGFLGYNKDVTNSYGPGDWLSWQTGLEEPDAVSFTVFGLPMEGLATFGLTGLSLYPFIFMLPVLYCCGRLSSLRRPWPASIFLFAGTQHMMLESTSDVFLEWLTHNLFMTFVGFYVLHVLLRPRTPLPHARAV